MAASKNNQSSQFCDYCGEDNLTKTHNDICAGEKERSVQALEEYRSFQGDENILTFAINVTYLCGHAEGSKDKTKKIKRARKLTELSNLVCALRNSDSGYILVHLVGLIDSNTQAFDEFADRKLQELINDGSLFTDVYKKKLLSDAAKPESGELKQFKKYTDFLSLYVEGSECLTTSDFKTKVTTDDGISDATGEILFKFLKDKKPYTNSSFPKPVSSCKEILLLRENRSTQFKAYFPNKDREVLVKSLLQLRITEYISTFTKIDTGGSWYWGVTEKKTVINSRTPYESKTPDIQPIPIENQCKLKQDILKEISDNILVCDYDGNTKAIDCDNIVNVYFVKCDFDGSTISDKYVICIQARAVPGLVFYDKSGPVAYSLDNSGDSKGNGRLTKLNFEKWFQLFKNRTNSQKQ